MLPNNDSKMNRTVNHLSQRKRKENQISSYLPRSDI